MLGKVPPPHQRWELSKYLEDEATRPEPLAEKVWGKKQCEKLDSGCHNLLFPLPAWQLRPQPPLPTLSLRRQEEWLPRTHSGASPSLDGPSQSSEEASALSQVPKGPCACRQFEKHCLKLRGPRAEAVHPHSQP